MYSLYIARAKKQPRPRPPLRERFVQAALELAADRGIGAVTTVALARAVGVSQPNFYACFSDVDDCLRAVAAKIGAAFVARNAEAFASVRERVDAGKPYLEVSVAFHERLFDFLLANPRVTELFIRHMHDESAFGLALRELERTEIERSAGHLLRWAAAAGVAKKYDADIRLLAEFHVGAVTTAALSLIEGRSKDRKKVARAVAVNADATARATIKRLLAEG